jgi:chaperone required for assembly of F1-ATPase
MKNGSGRQEGAEAERRFYETATIAEAGGWWRVLLDGRGVRTPLRAELLLPTEALAAAVAAEWTAQGARIDRRLMPLMRLANTAIDAVRSREADVAADILHYAGRDLLCYRAEGPSVLAARQETQWGPVLCWADEQFGARLITTAGIMPVDQPPEAIEALRRPVAELDAFPLTALHMMTSLTGSALLGLAHALGRLTVDEAWAAAHVDEDFQIERWGTDTEARARRTHRYADMCAASVFFQLSR